ncbi:hypothetical protein [Actinomyces bowdenii]|uniref:Uncharacterized protein n=1 Tax=Actinomyces bowdenii TaxID=131109 RepID=A0A3P1V8W7_9ACTO|nr:hypothetical protein [Actinomyces bowdenii]RRD30097.1 hypothetical protein EII10_03195 [Actinomyces bowdenii]
MSSGQAGGPPGDELSSERAGRGRAEPPEARTRPSAGSEPAGTAQPAGGRPRTGASGAGDPAGMGGGGIATSIDDEDVPAWLAEIVVMAEHVRAMLRLQGPLIVGGLLALLAAGWAGVPALPWLAAVCSLGAGHIALRHAHGPRGARLRPGAWAGLVLLVLDLALTPWALALALGLRLGGAPQPLLHAAACAAAGALVGAGALAAGLLVPARRPTGAGAAGCEAAPAGTSALGPVTAAVVIMLMAALLWSLAVNLSWWWAGAVAVAAEAGSLIVLRLGAWAEARRRRPGG